MAFIFVLSFYFFFFLLFLLLLFLLSVSTAVVSEFLTLLSVLLFAAKRETKSGCGV